MRANNHNQGRTQRNKKRLLVIAAFAVPIFLTSGLSSQTYQVACQNSHSENQDIGQCLANTGANNSWIAWLGGNSRSTQFQMIDLFELVNRPSKNAQQAIVTVREG